MKNYVKKHKGHKVPKGATWYQPSQGTYNEGFYKKVDGDWYFILATKGDKWEESFITNVAVELPEEQDLPNWDDAPEWADRALSHGEGEPWKFSDGEFFDCGNAIFGVVKHGGPSVGATEWASVGDFELIEMRPIAIEDKEWLPEVGEECEVESDTRDVWKKAMYVGVDSIGSHVFDVERTHLWRIDSIGVLVRPLKTAEELERDAFIEGCFNATPLGKTDTYVEMFGKMFDAGFTAPKGEG